MTGARLIGAVLANLLAWSGTVFYPCYGDLADQSAAGAVMMAEESVAMVALSAWLLWPAPWPRVMALTSAGACSPRRRVARSGVRALAEAAWRSFRA
jgi:hypothetical protein